MDRNHIHFAKGFAGEKDVISGMRQTCDIYVEINLAKIVSDDIPVYESANGVILTAGVDGYLPTNYFKRVTDNKGNYIHMADIDYIVVFDFECICNKDSNEEYKVQEIIEFPAVIIDCNKKQIVKAFQTYVKPTEYPELSEFCTELTGITQEQVDGGVNMQTALLMFHEFLSRNGVLGSEFVLM